MEKYYTVQFAATAEIEIMKSRFIAHAAPVANEQEAIKFIEKIKKQYWDATHNCYAYIVGNNHYQKAGDDGEPSGTAGKPILEAIKKSDLQDAVVVVTRYFGGTKLGAGGLVRAYGKSAHAGLEAAVIVAMEPHAAVKLSCEYALLGAVENIIRQDGYKVKTKDFAAQVELTVLVPCEAEQAFIVKITDRTGGQAAIECVGYEYVPKENNNHY